MSISEFDYQRLRERLRQRMAKDHPDYREIPAPPCESERQLHADILAECRRRGWICLHGSMAHRSHRTLGECDFCCLLPEGRVIFVECKTKTGKLTQEQLAIEAWMKKLGHTLNVVRSLKEFISVCEGVVSERT